MYHFRHIVFAIFSSALMLVGSIEVAHAQPSGNLENPGSGSNVSGIFLFSGWVCDADKVEIVIDGGSGLEAAYGTDRADTLNVCGDRDNGFGLLVNLNLLETGKHEAVAYADGQEFGRAEFQSVRLSTGEFSKDLAGLGIIYNFPEFGKEIVVWWEEASQNFFIYEERETPNPGDIGGVWIDRFTDTAFSITTKREIRGREELYVVSTGIDVGSTVVGGVYEGWIRGVRGEISSLLPSGFNLKASLTVNTIDEITVRVISCSSSDFRVECTFRAGQSFTLERYLGDGQVFRVGF